MISIEEALDELQEELDSGSEPGELASRYGALLAALAMACEMPRAQFRTVLDKIAEAYERGKP